MLIEVICFVLGDTILKNPIWALH